MVTNSTVGRSSAASLEITNFENMRRGQLSPRVASDEIMREREGGRRAARGDIELEEDVLDVTGHGVLADEQLERDFAVGFPACDAPEHLQLARGQSMCMIR